MTDAQKAQYCSAPPINNTAAATSTGRSVDLGTDIPTNTPTTTVSTQR